jgi:hypothetical protein
VAIKKTAGGKPRVTISKPKLKRRRQISARAQVSYELTCHNIPHFEVETTPSGLPVTKIDCDPFPGLTNTFQAYPATNSSTVTIDVRAEDLPPRTTHVYFKVFEVDDKDGKRLGPPVFEDRLEVDFEASSEASSPIQIISKTSVATEYKPQIALWHTIKLSAQSLSFNSYFDQIEELLCNYDPASPVPHSDTSDALRGPPATRLGLIQRRFLPFSDTDAYRFLKVATEAFVICRSAIVEVNTSAALKTGIENEARGINALINFPGDPVTSYQDDYLKHEGSGSSKVDLLPYFALVFDRLKGLDLIDTVFPSVADLLDKYPQKAQTCVGLLKAKMTRPLMIELIWSYWHEQAMQVQTMFAIRNRFQNIRAAEGHDPLAAMEIGHLRPLNNLLWGYIQDEQHRLTLARRNYEYAHHYGLTLHGKAVPTLQPAENRVKFLEAFHNLLYLCVLFFREDDDTNIRADAFPVLHSLKEMHFLLSEGAHNQFGDLPVTSRIEMLMEQWMLARPEFREFLPQRDSVAYPEPWMGPVDAMKTLQGWSSTSAMFFHDLGAFGEQLLLSIRYTEWSTIHDRDVAANWAKTWRDEIQGYIQAYRVVTGVDLSIEPDNTQRGERRLDPSMLILRRWEEQRQIGTAQKSAGITTRSPAAIGWTRPRPRIGRK